MPLSIVICRLLPVNSTTSPISDWSYIHCAFAMLMPVQPCEVFVLPWYRSDHGAACRNSPLQVTRIAYFTTRL